MRQTQERKDYILEGQGQNQGRWARREACALLSRLTSGKIWLAWVQWPLCGKPGNAGKW